MDYPSIYALATMDTKGEEITYVTDCIKRLGGEVVLVDVGTTGKPQRKADIEANEIAAHHPNGTDAVMSLTDRGEAVTAMSEALERYLLKADADSKLSGVIGIGGSGGTALIARAMRALPVGLPKVMVSTVASGNTQPYVDCSDITMMYSVVDVAGLNPVSRAVLSNAAHAIAGMAQHRLPQSQSKQTVGMTMFGVTTPCVNAVREALESEGYDCLVFHATGTGGRAMEKLIQSGFIQGALDITTTEVADHIAGGVFDAGPERFDAIISNKVPCVMSLGALDMVNFGSLETVPEKYSNRKLHVHNSQVTLMRTTPEENRKCAQWIANKVNQTTAPFMLLIPENGVSLIDVEGQPFHDPEADAALFNELEERVKQTGKRQIRRVSASINDPEFVDALLEAFREMTHANS